MKIDFPIEKTVTARSSVRWYQERPITSEDKDKIRNYIAGLSNPFSVKVSFHLLDKKVSKDGEKIGTYGMIKGATGFVGASVAPGELALEALGYSFEQLILYLTSMGFGTCWLGGTFDRSGFAAAMKLREGDLFPAISPIGYPQGKRRILDSMVRLMVKSDQRFEWSRLFFKGDFSHPLTQAEAGNYAFPLEMLRLAPSAANKQPWRIVQDKNAYHFYEARSMKDNKLGIDIQQTDVGIGACHFHLAALEQDLPGRFVRLEKPKIQTGEQIQYLFSWIAD